MIEDNISLIKMAKEWHLEKKESEERQRIADNEAWNEKYQQIIRNYERRSSYD